MDLRDPELGIVRIGAVLQLPHHLDDVAAHTALKRSAAAVVILNGDCGRSGIILCRTGHLAVVFAFDAREIRHRHPSHIGRGIGIASGAGGVHGVDHRTVVNNHLVLDGFHRFAQARIAAVRLQADLRHHAAVEHIHQIRVRGHSLRLVQFCSLARIRQTETAADFVGDDLLGQLGDIPGDLFSGVDIVHRDHSISACVIIHRMERIRLVAVV